MSSLQVSAVETKPRAATSHGVVVRRTAQYHPSIWSDHFLSYATNSTEMDEKTMQQAEELKEQVRTMLVNASNTLSQKLNLIDVVERLGVSYHFETEIEESLQQIHNNNDYDSSSSCELYNVSLKFRLLRQKGYHVSCDVFNKFKDNKGEFKETITSDVRGMLELFEATHLRVHGEDVLDEALAFTTTQLRSSLKSQLSPHLVAQVRHALKQALHKGMPRIEARHYIDIYQQDPSHNKVLLTFAKLDFNVVQKMHQKELCELTRWWVDLDFKTKLPYARDRLAELYLWILGAYHEPCYILGRKFLTKVIALCSVIDDTYDNYATFDELVLFTEAIQRWDNSASDQLPEYMQLLYTTILNVYGEIQDEMACQGKGYLTDYAKDSMKELVRAYFQEAKWFNQGYTPTMDEYMSVGLVTSGYSLLTTISLLGMGDFATKEAFDWVFSQPKIIEGASLVSRLMDDLVSTKFEQKRGHVASAIECYVKQHGVEEEEAIKELQKQVSDAWKDINNERLKPTCVPMPVLVLVLNFTRVMDVFYKDDDGYTNAHIYLKDFIASLLVDSIPI